MRFSIKDFFSKYVQTRKKLRIWSHLLKKSLMENFIFLCIVGYIYIFELSINPFLANVLISYPLKTREKLRFSGDFRRFTMETLARNGFRKYQVSLYRGVFRVLSYINHMWCAARFGTICTI